MIQEPKCAYPLCHHYKGHHRRKKGDPGKDCKILGCRCKGFVEPTENRFQSSSSGETGAGLERDGCLNSPSDRASTDSPQ